MTSTTLTLDPKKFIPQISAMLELQDSMNTLVFPDWATRNLAWHRAIYIEAGEYLEHLGTWKWWKKGVPDFPQANMELVDIWHFALSWYMARLGKLSPDTALVHNILTEVRHAVAELDTLAYSEITDEMRHEQVDQLVAAAGNRNFDTKAFVKLLAYSGMDFDQLTLRYIGKNMLNRFRQDNGYKKGTYIKVWNGQEDNVHLDHIVDTLEDASASNLPELIYSRLAQAYKQYAL
jgi:hypothetical protein